MENIQIFIDFAGGGDSEVRTYVQMLQSQLKRINENITVISFDDISNVDMPDAWEFDTLQAIKQSRIVIPILTPNYLNFMSEKIETEFIRLIESESKYLFPIMMEASEWSSFNWVVRSKIFPSDETFICQFEKAQVTSLINDFVNFIKKVVNQLNNPITKKQSDKSVGSIFISHSHEDADFAELLKLKLEKNGITSWVDNSMLKIGQDWREEIDAGIENSSAVVAIMTPDARKSEYVTYEWAFAWGKGKKIFPLMLKQTQLHPRLELLQYMDFTNRPLRPWDELINSIIKQI